MTIRAEKPVSVITADLNGTTADASATPTSFDNPRPSKRSTIHDGVGNIVTGAAMQVASGFAFAASTVVVIRHVGPSAFGELAVGATIAIIGKDVLDLGRSSLLARLQAEGAVETRRLAWRLIGEKTLLSPLILIPLLIASLCLSGEVHGHVLLFWLYCLLSATASTLTVPLAAAGRVGAMSGCSALERLVALVFIAGTVPLLGATAMPLGLSAGAAAVCICHFRADWVVQGRSMESRAFRRMARPFAVTSLANSAQQLDVPLVAAVGGAGVGGLFAALIRLTGPFTQYSAQTALFVFSRRARVKDRLLPHQAVRLVATMGTPCVIVLALAAWHGDSVLGPLLGSEFAAVAAAVWVVIVGIALNVVTAPLAGWTQARGSAPLAATASGASLVLYFVVLTVAAADGSLFFMAAAYSAGQAARLAVLAGGLVLRRCPRLVPVPRASLDSNSR